MKILITGVAGLLGSRLADWIVENHPDSQIIGIDDLSGGYADNINSNTIFYQLDLSKDSIDFIFNQIRKEFIVIKLLIITVKV